MSLTHTSPPVTGSLSGSQRKLLSRLTTPGLIRKSFSNGLDKYTDTGFLPSDSEGESSFPSVRFTLNQHGITVPPVLDSR